jgi:hypothetical protein
MGVDAKGILFQPIGVAWRLKNNGGDRVPALGRGERLINVAALGPGDAEAILGGADDTRDLDGDLDLADLGEGIAGARIIVERQRALIGDVVVGLERC